MQLHHTKKIRYFRSKNQTRKRQYSQNKNTSLDKNFPKRSFVIWYSYNTKISKSSRFNRRQNKPISDQTFFSESESTTPSSMESKRRKETHIVVSQYNSIIGINQTNILKITQNRNSTQKNDSIRWKLWRWFYSSFCYSSTRWSH